ILTLAIVAETNTYGFWSNGNRGPTPPISDSKARSSTGNRSQSKDLSTGEGTFTVKPSGGTDSPNVVVPNKASFKEVIQKKKGPGPPISLAYIVDLADETPQLSVENPEVLAHMLSLSQLAMIGRFNGIRPSSSALSYWISENWSKNCEVSFCSKGKFLKADLIREAAGLRTFAIFCTEIDLSKGLPNKIPLKVGNFQHIQTLNYENTAFMCRLCKAPGHLQANCPHGKKNQRMKSTLNKGGWNNPSSFPARKPHHLGVSEEAHSADSGYGLKNPINMAS
ncbi:hypothetical protein KI387_022710, partial [Taxus chinensis]